MEPNEITPADAVPAPAEELAPPPAPARPTGEVKVPSYRTPEALAKYDQETVELVNAHVLEIDQADAEYHEANEETKRLKKSWEAKLEDLQKLIKERREARGKPVQKTLLDVLPPEQAEVAPVPAEGTADPLDSLWRDYPLDRFLTHGLRTTDIQRLADGVLKNGGENRPCLTVGQLADYTANVGGAPGYERRLADFRGLGPAGVTRIEDGLQAFWSWWNRGGQAEYATERGVGNAGNPAGDGAADPVVAGGEGDGGEPAAPGPDAGEPPTQPEAESFVEPAQGDEAGEFSLGGDDAPQE